VKYSWSSSNFPLFPSSAPRFALTYGTSPFVDQCPNITAIKEERWKTHQLLRYTAKSPVPTLLSVHYESRSVMLSKAFALSIEGKFTRWILVSTNTSMLVLHFDFIGRGKLERKIDRISNVVSKETRNRIKTLGADFRCHERVSNYTRRFSMVTVSHSRGYPSTSRTLPCARTTRLHSPYERQDWREPLFSRNIEVCRAGLHD
jgi:hypothetical protein